jgi:hypothetical protein
MKADMGQGISEVLPFAVGVAISPVPIIAVILMLLSGRAHVNGPAFLLGWLAGLSALSAAVYVVADTIGVSGSSSGADGIAWLDVALGGLLLLVARRSWRKRPAPDTEPELPKWMADVDEIAPGRALVLGVVLSAVNPKNLALGVGAATGVAHLALPSGDAIVALAAFVVVGSLTVGGAVAFDLLGGARAKSSLEELRTWLEANNAAVMTVLFLVFGAVLVAKGLGLLSG